MKFLLAMALGIHALDISHGPSPWSGSWISPWIHQHCRVEKEGDEGNTVRHQRQSAQCISEASALGEQLLIECQKLQSPEQVRELQGADAPCPEIVKEMMQQGAPRDSKVMKWMTSLDEASGDWSQVIPIMWSGFSDDPNFRTSERASTDALEDIAREVHGALLNPKITDRHPDLVFMRGAHILRRKDVDVLNHCCWDAVKNFWLGLSFSFIEAWEKAQPAKIIIAVSKCTYWNDGRCKDVVEYEGGLLQKSVLLQQELPFLGDKIRNRVGWKPLIWVLDLHQSCDETIVLVENALGRDLAFSIKCEGCPGSLNQCWESAKKVDEFDAWSQEGTQLQPAVACKWKGITCTSGGDGDQVINIWWNERRMLGDLSRFAHLKNLRVLSLRDNPDLSGDCKQILQLQQLVRLDMRNTQVVCGMDTLAQFPFLRRIKLTGSPFYGNIEDLAKHSLTKLLGLELSRGGGRCNVTGNFDALKRFEGLDNLYLSGCNVSGDISALGIWTQMWQIYLADTRAYGTIGKDMDPFQSELREIEVARTSVTVDWSRIQLQDEKQKQPFPELTRLVMTSCPLYMDVDDFLAPFVLHKRLATIEASGCGLSGVFRNMRRSWLFVNGEWRASYPRYWAPKKIDLSGNQLSDVEGLPAISLVSINFSNNSQLIQVPDDFLASDIFMDLRGTPLNKESLFSSFKWHVGKDVSPQAHEGFECFPIAWKPKLLVTRETFAPQALCQCRPGHEGSGNHCKPCPRNYFANQANMEKCIRCPVGATTEEDGRYSVDYCNCPEDQVIDPGSIEQDGVGKCACKENFEFLVEEGKCKHCGDHMTTMDDQCVCWPLFFYNQTRKMCEECDHAAGFTCPSFNTQSSTWFVEPGWWHQDEFTVLPRPCWRSGICVYNSFFPQELILIRLVGVFPEHVQITMAGSNIKTDIERHWGQTEEFFFSLNTSMFEDRDLLQSYGLKIAFSQNVELEAAFMQLSWYLCASNSALVSGSPELCWYPLGFVAKTAPHDTGATISLFQRCKHGHWGPLCQSCAAGWYKRTALATCQPCTDRRTERTVMIVGIALLLAVAGAFAGHRWAKSAGYAGLKEVLRLKIETWKNILGWKYLWPKLRHFIFSCQMLHTISHLRSTSVFNTESGGAASTYTRLILEGFGELDFTILSMRRLAQCLYPQESFYALYWFTMLQVFAILLAAWWITVFVLRGGGADVMSTAIVIYNLTGLKLASRSIMFLSCDRFATATADQAFLTASYDTTCGTWLHRFHTIVGLAFFSFWCFIIPFGLCVRMRRFRSMLCPSIPAEVAEREFGEEDARVQLALRETYRASPELRPVIRVAEKELQIYFSLSESCRPSCWWFDVMGMSRRQLLAAILILPQRYQLLIGLYYCMAMVFLILVVSPALDWTDSLMEGASYAAMALTLGLLDQPQPTPMLWLPLMLPFLVLLWLLCRAYVLPSKGRKVWDRQIHEQKFMEQFRSRETSSLHMLRRKGTAGTEVETVEMQQLRV